MSLALPSQVRRESQKSDLQLTICRSETEDSAELPCPPIGVRGAGSGIRGSVAGERASLERLIIKHRPLLKKLVAGYVRDMDDAEDLESMTVLAICRRFDSYDPTRGAFGTWLGAILRNEAADMRRRTTRLPECLPNSKETERLIESAPAPKVDPVPDGVYEDEFELTPLLKRAFELVKLQGLTCAEAASVMGKTEGTVRTYVWKARQVMRGALA